MFGTLCLDGVLMPGEACHHLLLLAALPNEENRLGITESGT